MDLLLITVENFALYYYDKSQRFTPEDMHKELIGESVHNAQFSHDEIPKVETIHNWVSRYSAEMKRDVADKNVSKLQ
ncbi:1961_t:CDS:2 [Entrophospora sp. SA101]|nr:1961_t:CDS:2 [Entrophospora sp. SA101]